ncbi:MAG: cysteine synthase B [Cytophagaceae bacterium SCN 52-12]|nr:MAG: cysteine synthase B [Cytophagaceae bacterium SCN 52-12]
MSRLLDLIGNTPLVELTRLNPNPEVKLLAKLEGDNPGGSVKDRTAYFMVKGALARGDLKPGMKLVEATSGNTGIALAMIAGLFDIEIELVMPASSTRERILTMEAYGAKVTLEESMEAARDSALEKAAKGDYLILNQFANPDNWRAHYETTGPEIWRDTGGEITHFVSSMGTTGTIMGCSRFLKEHNPGVRIVGCQPKDGASIPGIRKWPVEYLPALFERERVDEVVEVSENDAVSTTRMLARQEGIFAGMSSGGAAFAAIEVAKRIKSGTVVFVVCDRGDRYLSSNLFG